MQSTKQTIYAKQYFFQFDCQQNKLIYKFCGTGPRKCDFFMILSTALFYSFISQRAASFCQQHSTSLSVQCNNVQFH